MINFIKNDFRNVREALSYVVNKKIPMWVVVLYYMVVGLLVLPFVPLLLLINKIMLRRLTKKYGEDAE